MIKLPTSALRKEGQGTAVWVLDKATMTVKSQPVQIATADGNEAVIAAGLQPGMLVVSAGVHVLSPGQKVAIYQEQASPAATPCRAGRRKTCRRPDRRRPRPLPPRSEAGMSTPDTAESRASTSPTGRWITRR